MLRILQLGGLLLAIAGAGFCEQAKAVKAPPPNKNGVFRPVPKGGVPKGGAPRMGPRIGNPASWDYAIAARDASA